MKDEKYSIGELSELLGISRRTVRFYVQKGLLPKPIGLGRATHYSSDHLKRLREIARLQDMGLALDAIAQVLRGEMTEDAAVAEQNPVSRGQRSRKNVSVEQWLRVILQKGLELHINTCEIEPTAEQLEDLQKSIIAIFNK